MCGSAEPLASAERWIFRQSSGRTRVIPVIGSVRSGDSRSPYFAEVDGSAAPLGVVAELPLFLVRRGVRGQHGPAVCLGCYVHPTPTPTPARWTTAITSASLCR